VQLLLDRGASPQLTDDRGWSALRIAEEEGHGAVAALLH
jgi:ankyrin repeat protein